MASAGLPWEARHHFVPDVTPPLYNTSQGSPMLSASVTLDPAFVVGPVRRRTFGSTASEPGGGFAAQMWISSWVCGW